MSRAGSSIPGPDVQQHEPHRPEAETAAAPPSALRLAVSRGFVTLLCATAVPVMLQSLVSSSRTLIDSFLVSHLGTDEVAAIGYAGRVIYVIIMATLGMADGGAVIVAQFWGNGSHEKTRQATAINVAVAGSVATAAFVICFTGSKWIAGLGTDDPSVVALSAGYIRIASAMIIPFAVISALAATLRCLGEAKVAMRCTLAGAVIHILIAYALVFGVGAIPALGLRGAAWATVISAYIECLFYVVYIYGTRHLMAFGLRDIRDGLRNVLLKKILVVGGPVSLSSAAWASGILVYAMLVGQGSTQNLAALSMVSTLESAAIAVINGVSTASAVIVGNSLGENREQDHTWRTSKALLIWNTAIAFTCGILLLLTSLFVGVIYSDVDGETISLARDATVVLAALFIFRAMSMTLQNGLLRAGGDTLYILYADLSCQWIVAIPLTYFAAITLHLPFPVIFVAIYTEEIAKTVASSYRVYRRKWMRRFID
ncbi:hypothetical protein ACM01_29335 [Streptomyces viridochromogenes]|uniref:Probable multidrug resistance protein NorM n=1 Tax=Streptomyces viridochromogenes TaxID=1938 RepID=A0A0J7Z594_STRVR|nr:MATE family efflux transporter [Streptomyces viridochromogenes]KMS70929.1 hypothetical protein ACM01_29335 [Streptomyces viridochromogenes]